MRGEREGGGPYPLLGTAAASISSREIDGGHAATEQLAAWRKKTRAKVQKDPWIFQKLHRSPSVQY
jgi:hypothetical protein